jgi:Cu+-exporting ATPase
VSSECDAHHALDVLKLGFKIRLPGITKATVNFALEQANVEFIPSNLSKNEIVDVIKQLGYRTSSTQDQNINNNNREIVSEKSKLVISELLSLPLLRSIFSHFSED